MKAKTNLELFKNEMIYNLEHRRCKSLYDAMVAIYVRESPSKVINYENILNWFLDAPRETLELSKEIYDFLKAYNDEVMCEQNSIDNYAATSVLIDIGIIPKKYAKYKVIDLIKIIKVKKESNK